MVCTGLYVLLYVLPVIFLTYVYSHYAVKYGIPNSCLMVCNKSAELGVLMFNNCSYFHQFVFPEGDPAGPQYVEEWNKLVLPQIYIMCTVLWAGITQSV